MPEYRFYKIKDGHVQGPPTVHDLPRDSEAVAQGHELLADLDIEIWQGARVVAYLVPGEKPKRLPQSN